MKKNFYIFLLICMVGLILGVPVLLYYKENRFFEILVIGSSGFLIILSLAFLFSQKSKIKLPALKIIAAYLLLISLTFPALYLKHSYTNLPDPLLYFNKNKILTDSTNNSTDIRFNKFDVNLLWKYFNHHHENRIEEFFNSQFKINNDSVSINKLKAEADSVCASSFALYSYPYVKLQANLTWKENPFNDASWNFSLHTMEYLNTLVLAYNKLNNINYLKRAEDLILDWISKNSKYILNPPSVYSWSDHSTALRLRDWLFFWEVWSKTSLFKPGKMKIILSSMISHAVRLSDPKFYTYHHNHGIDQDISLLSMTMVFPELKKSHEWQALALHRLKDQIKFAVSPNGIQLEHSPAYHIYGFLQLESINYFLKLMDLQNQFGLNLDQILNKMIHYMKYIIMPDYKIVPVGDTKVLNIEIYYNFLEPYFNQDKGLEFILTKGKTGSLNDTAVAFPQEGYAIIRDLDNGRIPFNKSFYLFFTDAAHKEHGHRHFDDLSFVLSYGGYNLLIDPGFYSYNSGKFRDYVISTAAHNTTEIDDKSFMGWNTTFEKFQNNPVYTLIQASHRNYPGFECRRKLIRIKPNIILLEDQIKPFDINKEKTGIHKFDQFFHTSSNIIIKTIIPGKEVQFLSSDSSVQLMRILQLEPDSTRINIFKGSLNPVQGWTTLRQGNMEPAPVVDFTKHGTYVTYITAIELNNSLVGKIIKRPKWSTFSYNPYEKIISIINSKRHIDVDLKSLEINMDSYIKR